MNQKAKNKQPIPTKNHSNQSSPAIHAAVHQSYSGPIPPASQIEHYERILPGAAERLFKLAEANSQHVIDFEKRKLDLAETQIKNADSSRLLGQIFGLICFIMVMLLCIYALYKGYNLTAISGVVFAIGSVVGAFLYTKHLENPSKKSDK